MRAFLLRRMAAETGTEPDVAVDELGDLAASEDLQVRAWSLGAVAAGLNQPADRTRRAELAAEAARSCVALTGIDDDFVYHWAHAVEAAAEIGDEAAVEEMLDIVRTQPPGLRNPLVRAEFLRLRATYAQAAQADPEADLRQAIAELVAFGSPFRRAQAQVTLAELLATRGAGPEAEALVDQARVTFTELDATPWLDRTDQVLSRV
jgi:hypothetical protein